MSRRHKKHHDDHEEHPSEAWLVAFADMMTLLMVTFLMMFAISILDLKKFQSFQEAFTQGLGKNTHQLPGVGAPPEGAPRDVPIGAKEGTPTHKPRPMPDTAGRMLERKDLEDLKKKIDAAVRAAGLEKAVQSEVAARGLVLYVTSGVLFSPGEARLTRTGGALLDRLGPVLEPIGNDLVIEGHTDKRPISTADFPSNWELSTARATAVLRDLLERTDIPGSRLAAAGYADTHPRGKGSSEEALALNRRVDIVVETPTELAPEQPTPTTTPTEAAAAGGGAAEGEAAEGGAAEARPAAAPAEAGVPTPAPPAPAPPPAGGGH